jgi:SAM-dependent methyltransferase
LPDPQEEIWRSAERRRAGFDAIASAYDRHRPGYPDATFDDLMDLAGLSAGDAVIEVGSGTGIATAALVERGLKVTCLEPAPAMAAVAQEKLAGRPGVTHVPCRFEDWDGPPGQARALVAADAWHWVRPDVGFARAAEALGPGGCLGIVFHRIVQIGPAGFTDAVRALRRRVAPPSQQDVRAGAFLEEHDWVEDMVASGRFERVATTHHRFTRMLTALEFVANANTYGPAMQAPSSTQAELDASLCRLVDTMCGGQVAKTEEAVLFLGRRRPDPGATR